MPEEPIKNKKLPTMYDKFFARELKLFDFVSPVAETFKRSDFKRSRISLQLSNAIKIKTFLHFML